MPRMPWMKIKSGACSSLSEGCFLHKLHILESFLSNDSRKYCCTTETYQIIGGQFRFLNFNELYHLIFLLIGLEGRIFSHIYLQSTRPCRKVPTTLKIPTLRTSLPIIFSRHFLLLYSMELSIRHILLQSSDLLPPLPPLHKPRFHMQIQLPPKSRPPLKIILRNPHRLPQILFHHRKIRFQNLHLVFMKA